LVYLRRRGTAIVDTPKGILVVSESGRGYLLPGGNARKGESRRKAAIRELAEETGLKATDVSYLFEIKGGIHKNRRGHSFRTSHKVFLIKTTGTAMPKGEIKHLAYVKDQNSLNLSQSTKTIIERYNEIKNLMLLKNDKEKKTTKKDVNSSSKCYYCGKEELIPFKCNYCGDYFCAEHRLPEMHNCADLPPRQWKSKIYKQEPDDIPLISKITKSTLREICPKCGSERTMITAFRKNCDILLCMDCNTRWKTNEIEKKGKRYHNKKRKKGQIVKYIIAALVVFSLSFILTVYFTRPDMLTELLPNSNEIDYLPEEPETTEPDTSEPEGNTETSSPENILPYEDRLETNHKIISLKYFLMGEKSYINFTVYGGVNEYLNELSRSISYYPWEPEPTKRDFVMQFLNDEIQSNYLTDLVQEIREETGNKEDQARIAISLVQQIPYDWEVITYYSIENRYPYEVLYDNTGVCEEKSRLLAFLLRELGFDVVLFSFESENHMAVGIMCPVQYSYKNTGYCFIETTRPTIITFSQGEYVGAGKLTSAPEMFHICDGFSFDSLSEEYNDAQEWFRLINLASSTGGILEQTDYNKWQSLVIKYGIEISD
jgi:ADP-ribose pyrophosphatase YjhB (NUDIX family)